MKLLEVRAGCDNIPVSNFSYDLE